MAAKKRKSSSKSSSARDIPAGTSPSGRVIGKGEAFPIVCIGASAGGLEAIRRLLEAMPDEPGVALVVVQHLDPTKKSLAVEMLSRCTKMPVCQVEDDPRVKPNHIYVIPPGKYLSISRGELHLSEPEVPRGARLTIDFFLRSLAKYDTSYPVAVVLSGTGTDGTLGVKAVKAAGGLVIAQDPTSAEHPGMPRSAIATGTVDHVLSPEKIPGVLVRFAQHPFVRERTVAAPAEEAEESDRIPTDGIHAILALLRTHTKQDFRSYREKALVRRTRRRMCLYHFDEYDQYVQYLRAHPEEIAALSRDLLISVTDFFRDPEAWEELRRKAIEPIVAAKEADAPIRIWTPGCATGEEPYSLVMLLLEELQRVEKTCPLLVFASDVDKGAIEFARAGRYPKSIEADVSPVRLKRFFTAEDGDDYYLINNVIRESVVFAEQNLIGDPPFSRLDLICCRNLLIYLKPDVQEKVIALFHFALNEGGVLFLGNSETIGRQSDLFLTLDKRWRIYRRVGPTRHDRVDIPLTTTGRRHELEPTVRPLRRDQRLTHLVQQQLLDLLAPTAVLIDRNWRMLHICGDVEPFVTRKPGVPSDNLLDNARRGLRTELRAAVHKAMTDRRPVTVTARVQRDSTATLVGISVHVIRDREQDEDLALIVFSDTERARGLEASSTVVSAEQSASAQVDAGMHADTVIRRLEEELTNVRSDLQATIEQLEASNEEFKAANEEVTSINEELQCTNEELETSKEELQSLNEELSTVNSQLAAKVDESETKHADLENLTAATEVPTVCLDTDLLVRWFTPAAQKVIRLKPADRGRLLADLAHDFSEADLVAVARRVLSELTPVTDEVKCTDGRTFLRRVQPYRAGDHRIGGVVITFWDITERKKTEEQLSRDYEAMSRLQILSTLSSREGKIEPFLAAILDAATAITEAEFGRVELLDSKSGRFRVAAQRGFPQSWVENRHSLTEVQGSYIETLARGERVIIEDVEQSVLLAGTPWLAAHLKVGVRSLESTPLLSRNDKLIGIFSTYYRNAHRPDVRAQALLDLLARQAAEIIARSQAEDELRRMNVDLEQSVADRTQDARRLATIVETAHDAIYTRALDNTVLTWNASAARLYGYVADKIVGQSCSVLIPPNRRDELDVYRDAIMRGETIAPFETTRFRKDGQVVWVSIALSPIKDEKGQIVGIASIGRDITARKELEREVVEIASLEQRRIGQDLHDSVAQELIALNLLAKDLCDTLHSDSKLAERLSTELSQGLQRSQEGLRRVMRGLIPVAVDSHGLMSALADLADSTRRDGKICTFDCPEAIEVRDNLTATHLFLIAQEAVRNAVRHGEAQRIRVTLQQTEDDLVLRVQDDGIGISAETIAKPGLGLRIMRNRASIIGARFTLEPTKPHGTIMTCVLSRRSP